VLTDENAYAAGRRRVVMRRFAREVAYKDANCFARYQYRPGREVRGGEAVVEMRSVRWSSCESQRYVANVRQSMCNDATRYHESKMSQAPQVSRHIASRRMRVRQCSTVSGVYGNERVK